MKTYSCLLSVRKNRKVSDLADLDQPIERKPDPNWIPSKSFSILIA